jgi:hypothetical protein
MIVVPAHYYITLQAKREGGCFRPNRSWMLLWLSDELRLRKTWHGDA